MEAKSILFGLIIAAAWLAGGPLMAQIQPGGPNIGGTNDTSMVIEKCEDAAKAYGLRDQDISNYVVLCMRKWEEDRHPKLRDFTPPQPPRSMQH
jgi:hypothetical protein